MAKQIGFHDFVNSEGQTIRVALLDNDAIRVTYRKTTAAVSWHATSRNAPNDDSVTIVTPTGEFGLCGTSST
jgi:hypothetical protein